MIFLHAKDWNIRCLVVKEHVAWVKRIFLRATRGFHKRELNCPPKINQVLRSTRNPGCAQKNALNPGYVYIPWISMLSPRRYIEAFEFKKTYGDSSGSSRRTTAVATELSLMGLGYSKLKI